MNCRHVLYRCLQCNTTKDLLFEIGITVIDRIFGDVSGNNLQLLKGLESKYRFLKEEGLSVSVDNFAEDLFCVLERLTWCDVGSLSNR